VKGVGRINLSNALVINNFNVVGERGDIEPVLAGNLLAIVSKFIFSKLVVDSGLLPQSGVLEPVLRIMIWGTIISSMRSRISLYVARTARRLLWGDCSRNWLIIASKMWGNDVRSIMVLGSEKAEDGSAKELVPQSSGTYHDSYQDDEEEDYPHGDCRGRQLGEDRCRMSC
jgi:hypothetical protein